MSIRRGWTVEQDRVLKLLKQERKIKKWSSIAKIMDLEFNMCGRNGKQCRERYNNHLDDEIVQNRFSLQEEKILENLNDQIGNKWSVIAKAFKGRTANFLKNQLYSKLRKSIRKLNKFMKEMKIKQVKAFKLTIVYKIVQSNDFKIFQRQRHTQDDLKLYSQEIKNKMFRFAEKPPGQRGNELNDQSDVMAEARDIIAKLNEFQKKYETLHKKMKKPRKRYFCEDDIILNSLSNNKQTKSPNDLPSSHQFSNNSSQSQQSESHSQSSSLTSDKKQQPNKQPNKQTTKLEIKQFESRHFQNFKEKDLLEMQKQAQPKTAPKQQHSQQQTLQQSANQNCKIVQQAEILHHHGNQNKASQLLEQSQQCQFIDIQYLDHFKSCSMIDESLFQ